MRLRALQRRRAEARPWYPPQTVVKCNILIFYLTFLYPLRPLIVSLLAIYVIR
jgi:hypothetical protein